MPHEFLRRLESQIQRRMFTAAQITATTLEANQPASLPQCEQAINKNKLTDRLTYRPTQRLIPIGQPLLLSLSSSQAHPPKPTPKPTPGLPPQASHKPTKLGSNTLSKLSKPKPTFYTSQTPCQARTKMHETLRKRGRLP